jgi:hypothetical protein
LDKKDTFSFRLKHSDYGLEQKWECEPVNPEDGKRDLQFRALKLNAYCFSDDRGAILTGAL